MNLVYEAASTPNYNGNIGSINWRNSSDEGKKTYDYTYDNLNRLTAAAYSQETSTTSALPTSDQFTSGYTYDRNGNIKTLTRNGFSGSTYEQIDNLGYIYADDGALSSITESSNKESGFKSKTAGGTGAYTYDDNGNMLTDIHKGMSVDYNYLNLPTKIIKPEGEIEWMYDATGTKLSKTVTTDHLEINLNPIFNKEYKTSMTIESDGTVPNDGDVTFTAGQSITLKEGFTATEGSDFLARIMPSSVMQVRDYCGGIEYFESSLEAIYFADGRVKYDGANSEREYIIVDHLNNTRVLFRDNNGVAEEMQSNSYYPHGSVHEEQSDYLNKYLNEGKELQTELSLAWSDYHLRCKDNWMGRFTGIDVLADTYSNTSPYSYGLGNPVSNGDPTGASVEKFTGDEAQQVFAGVQNSYNSAVSSGQNANFSTSEINGLAGSFMNGGGGNGLSLGENNSLSSKFPTLFGQINYGGLNQEKSNIESSSEEESSIWTRIGGALQMVGGGLEIYAAAGLTATGIGTIAAVGMGAHGVDNLQAGGRAMWTGRRTRTFTSQGLQNIGLGESSAEMVDAGLGFVSGLAGGIRGGLNLFKTQTGGAGAWLRIKPSYSRAGSFNTRLSATWGSNTYFRNRKIGSPFLRGLNARLRNSRIPLNNWRTIDQGHFHIIK